MSSCSSHGSGHHAAKQAVAQKEMMPQRRRDVQHHKRGHEQAHDLMPFMRGTRHRPADRQQRQFAQPEEIDRTAAAPDWTT